MADHFYGLNIGGGMPTDVTVGTVTSGQNIELRIHDGASVSKTDVYKALEALEYYIATHDAPA